MAAEGPNVRIRGVYAAPMRGAASRSRRVLVLEQGHVREEGPVRVVLDHPSDAYTRRLLEAAPRIGAA